MDIFSSHPPTNSQNQNTLHRSPGKVLVGYFSARARGQQQGQDYEEKVSHTANLGRTIAEINDPITYGGKVVESHTRQIEEIRKQDDSLAGMPPVVSWLLVFAVVGIMAWLAIGLWPS